MHKLQGVHHWKQYRLIDTGEFEKLEQFGQYILIRPEPQAVWSRTLPEAEWLKQAHARFRQTGSHNGEWEQLQPTPEQWALHYEGLGYGFDLRLARTAFKHVGVFPEQGYNWDFVYEQCRRIQSAEVLNLFAYTGAATVAAAKAGANVTHVDAVKQIVYWARENAQINRADHVRWLVDDAVKFVQREVRREKRYNGILLDPPAFGHGPKGERWIIEQHINGLMAELTGLLHPKQNFFVFNTYSLNFSPLILSNLVYTHFNKKHLNQVEYGELYLPEEAGRRRLPAGAYARFFN